MNKKVCVIGGGFTGLACATELHARGCTVTLTEKQNVFGGLAAGFKEPGWNYSLEHYYHHWFESDKWVKKYADIWNCKRQLVFKNPSTVMQTNSGKFVRLDSAFALLKYPDFSIANRFRMGLCLAWLKAQKNVSSLYEISAEEWCIKYMGIDGYSAIWRPLLEGKFGSDIAKTINMAWLWARLTCRTPMLGTINGGFQNYIDHAVEHLKSRKVTLQLGREIHSLVHQENKWIVNGDHFDAVVFATGPQAFQGAAQNFAPKYSQLLNQRQSLGAQVIILSLNQSLGDHYWYSLKSNANQPFLALIEHTKFISAKEFGGEHIVYLARYSNETSESWTNEQILASSIATLCQVNSNFSKNNVNRHWIFREKYAQPIATVGTCNPLPVTIDEAPGLFHASMAHVEPWDRGTNFALELGNKVARIVTN